MHFLGKIWLGIKWSKKHLRFQYQNGTGIKWSNFDDRSITVTSCKHHLCHYDNVGVFMDSRSGKWFLKNHMWSSDVVCETTVSRCLHNFFEFVNCLDRIGGNNFSISTITFWGLHYSVTKSDDCWILLEFDQNTGGKL